MSWEETHTQVQLAFEQAGRVEGLLEAALERADALGRHSELGGEDELSPILLAVSDSRPQIISANTYKFIVMFAIAEYFGQPFTPTDQAWIKPLNGTTEDEWPSDQGRLTTRVQPGAQDSDTGRRPKRLAGA